MIDIGNADKAEVLMHLINCANGSGVDPRPDAIALVSSLPKVTYETTLSMVRSGDLYLDYCHGKILKVDLQGSVFDECLYDRDNGKDAAKKALANVEGVVFL